MNTQLRKIFDATEAIDANSGMRTRYVERSRALIAMENTCTG